MLVRMLGIIFVSVFIAANVAQASAYMPVGSCRITTEGIETVYSVYVPTSDELEIGLYTGRIDVIMPSYAYTVDNARIHVKNIAVHEVRIGAEYSSKYQFKDVVVSLDYTFPSSLTAPPGSGNYIITDKVSRELECYRTESDLYQRVDGLPRQTVHTNM